MPVYKVRASAIFTEVIRANTEEEAQARIEALLRESVSEGGTYLKTLDEWEDDDPDGEEVGIDLIAGDI